MTQPVGITLDAGMEGWIRKTAINNYWRVASYMSIEDLIQDGFLWYCECRQRYAHVTNRAHFMSLLMRCFKNHITDLSIRKSRLNECTISSLATDESDESWWSNLLGAEGEISTMVRLVKEAPPELAAVFNLLLTDAGREKLRGAFKREGGQRETTNEWLCRLVHLDPKKVDLRGMIQRYVMEGTCEAS